MANIQISEELFVRMCQYHLLGDQSQAEAVQKGLQSKLDALQRRSDYTKYKTAETPQERSEARKRYLDSAGVPDAFRW
jgi:hypothetical protein